MPVVASANDGLRIILGTHDPNDLDKPDVQIERRHNGWMLFLHPVGGADPSGYVVFLDDGRSYFVAESNGGPTPPGEIVDFEVATAELDDCKPTATLVAEQQDEDETSDEPLVIDDVTGDVRTSSDGTEVDESLNEAVSEREQVSADEFMDMLEVIEVRLKESFHPHVVDAFDCEQILDAALEWLSEDDDVVALQQVM